MIGTQRPTKPETTRGVSELTLLRAYQARLRSEPCACGTRVIVLDGELVEEAVAWHVRSVAHLRWRVREGGE